MRKTFYTLVLLMAFPLIVSAAMRTTNNDDDLTQFVDPRIGSEGLGRVFIGPAAPFGMVRPGPDCTCKPNSGWLPMPEVVSGFSQTHVSGTGGGPKYGNILVQPFLGELQGNTHEQRRTHEEISLGYYATTFESGIRTEITTAECCAFYKFTYPTNAARNLLIDAGFFLGYNAIPDAREAQQFVGSEVEVIGNQEIRGFTRIRGGWNNGRAYTVYFCAMPSEPFTQYRLWDEKGKRGVMVTFGFGATTVRWKIGISFISSLQAKQNIPNRSFEQQQEQLKKQWNALLQRIQLGGHATEQQKRMFYTAIYHTCLMPSDRTGENPLWTDDAPYYDDFYALWDTYRTSLPLITLIDEQREIDLVNSLLNICKRDGFLPDARSGNANGRTQGGSNAEIVIADAFCKRLKGIDYEEALRAMLKDALVAPGGNEEQEGRGGLEVYNRLGYIPYGIDRAGNRTVEYAYDDWCIAQMARAMGYNELYQRFMRQSANWKNLWRSDLEYDGMRGFIMPKDKDGNWLDSVPWGRRKHATHDAYSTLTTKQENVGSRFLIPYTPTTKVAPWYIPWWSTFFYEATSEEYSLSIPHDVQGLIVACGGNEKFRQRLDLFFQKRYYNVANEPSFLTPCLYHWLQRPDLSSERVRQIVDSCFTDKPDGLPGNDDSGAMSSWLAFHLLGLYPNAGQPYYLLNTPMVDEYTLNQLYVTAPQLSAKNCYVQYVLLDGKRLDRAWLTHEELTQSHELQFVMGKKRSTTWGKELPPTEYPTITIETDTTKNTAANAFVHQPKEVAFTLNRQYRTWDFQTQWRDNDTLVVTCRGAQYLIGREAVEHADHFCWLQPIEGKRYTTDGTFLFISRDALRQLQTTGHFTYDGQAWRLLDRNEQLGVIHVRAEEDRAEMWISTRADLPLVLETRNSPIGIDWRMQ